MHCRLIRELTLYEFEQSYNAAETTKSICCAKDEGAVDLSTVTSWFKKFHSGCKKLAVNTTSRKLNTMVAIDANPAGSTWKVLGERSILQPYGVRHFHVLGKNIWSCRIMSQVTKIWQKILTHW